ncbi:MAG TPA: hypothetical protein VFJ58_22900 [Armatimonadota bacterium]|nr:hypothetical protein [Armatimonadota bacterium]
MKIEAGTAPSNRRDRSVGAAPSFSIVVAGAGDGHFEHVLESALRQLYPGPVEIIAVETPLSPPASGGRPTPSPLAETAAARSETPSPLAGRVGVGSVRNRAIAMARGEYVAVVSEEISLWYLLTCARALQRLGRRGAVFATAQLCAIGVRSDCPEYPDVIPAPYKTPDLEFTGAAWAGPGATAFHRSVLETGLRYDETAPAGILDDEFLCQMDDREFRVAELPSNLVRPVAWPDGPLQVERVLEEETAFLERHPHARLRGSRSLALEAVDAGGVDVLITANGADDGRLQQTRLSLERQSYTGTLGAILCDDARQSRLGRERLEGAFVLVLDVGTVLSPQHIRNCVNLLRYQGASCVCGSDLAPDRACAETIEELDRWPGVQPIPKSGIPFGAAAPAGALFMSRRMY